MVIGCGNFGAPPQPPFRASKVDWSVADGRPQALGGRGCGLVAERLEQAGREVLLGTHALGDAMRGGVHLIPLLGPHLRDAGEELAERGDAVARLVWEVGAAEEGPPVRGQEDAHGPAALPGHGLHGVHVDGIEVGPLLAVDLDGHEASIRGRRPWPRPRMTRAP